MSDYTDHLLLWVDVETTGLDTRRDDILEIGLILTDMNGNQIDGAIKTVLRPRLWRWKRRHLPDRVREMHTANGLLDLADDAWTARAAQGWIRADIQCLAHLHEVTLAMIHPAGSSVRFDLNIIDRRMPGLLDGLHHRVLDISSLRMAVDATAENHGEERRAPIRDHQTTHRVLDCLHRDIDDYRRIASEIILPGLAIHGRTSRD